MQMRRFTKRKRIGSGEKREQSLCSGEGKLLQWNDAKCDANDGTRFSVSGGETRRRRRATINRCSGRNEPTGSDAETQKVFNGMYGPWTLDSQDFLEVGLYRGGLSSLALGICNPIFLRLLERMPVVGDPGSRADIDHILATCDNASLLLVLVGLGMAVSYIHVYITPAKRFLQLLWLAGVIGCASNTGLFIANEHEHPQSILSFILSSSLIWKLVSLAPLASAVTGIAFKEAICYQKKDALTLALAVPLCTLTILASSVTSQPAQNGVNINSILHDGSTSVVAAAVVLFATGKYAQPVADDVGDKSVFMYIAQEKKRQQQS